MSYEVDYTRNTEHEAAVRIAERNLRPFSRYFVIGRPVTYNMDLLRGVEAYIQLADIIRERHAGPKHPDFKRQRKNKLATNIRKRARRLKQVLGVGMLFSMLAAAGGGQAAAQQLLDAPQATLEAVAGTAGVTTVRESKPALPVRKPWLTRSEALDAGMMLGANLGDYATTQRFLRVGGKDAEVKSEEERLTGRDKYRRAVDSAYHRINEWLKMGDDYVVDVADYDSLCQFVSSHRIACVWAVLRAKQAKVRESNAA